MATRLGKVSVHANLKERQCNEFSDYHTIALTSHTDKIFLKILHTSLQQYVI